MTGRLTLHALDTGLGRPAAGLGYTLYRIDGAAHHELVRGRTNADGRCDQPLLAGTDLLPGLYEILFDAGAYLGPDGPEAPFYDQIPIRFRVGDPTANYHVPLILARHGYTTYRGS
jgi:5-hydroxyisourate hydrolase